MHERNLEITELKLRLEAETNQLSETLQSLNDKKIELEDLNRLYSETKVSIEVDNAKTTFNLELSGYNFYTFFSIFFLNSV